MSSGAEGEQTIEARCREERYEDATVVLLELYGSEITGLLVALARDDAQAADAYSLFCERVWRALPRFRFESSVRTWAYVIARRALGDVHRALHKGPPMVAASPSALPDVIDQARSSTRPHLRTTNKRELQRLRDLLEPDDQMLLVLRLDRGMNWSEIARVLSDDDGLDAEQLGRHAAALRKRFSRVKTRLGAEFRASRTSEEG